MILRISSIRPFSGRIVGLLLGLLAGPVGAVFGLLIGWMVDQYRSNGVSALRFYRFLTDPRRERNPDHRATYTTAAIAVEILTAESWPGEDTIGVFLDQRWPQGGFRGKLDRGDKSTSRSRKGDREFRRRIFDLCLIERHRIDLERILSVVDATFGDAGCLIELLVKTLTVRGLGITAEERRILERVAEAIGVELPEIARLEAFHGTLSRRECEILGVNRDADRRTIKRSYHTLVAQLHPDTGASLDGEHREMMEGAFLRIHEAYEILLRQLDDRGSVGNGNAVDPRPE